MKKLIALFLAACMVLTLCACGTKPDDISLEYDCEELGKKLTLNLEDDDGAELEAVLSPKGAKGEIEWSSSDKDVIKIRDNEDGTCTLRLKDVGTAKITASCGDDVEASVKITVESDEVPAPAVTAAPAVPVAPGAPVASTASAVPNGIHLDDYLDSFLRVDSVLQLSPTGNKQTLHTESGAGDTADILFNENRLDRIDMHVVNTSSCIPYTLRYQMIYSPDGSFAGMEILDEDGQEEVLYDIMPSIGRDAGSTQVNIVGPDVNDSFFIGDWFESSIDPNILTLHIHEAGFDVYGPDLTVSPDWSLQLSFDAASGGGFYLTALSFSFDYPFILCNWNEEAGIFFPSYYELNDTVEVDGHSYNVVLSRDAMGEFVGVVLDDDGDVCCQFDEHGECF